MKFQQMTEVEKDRLLEIYSQIENHYSRCPLEITARIPRLDFIFDEIEEELLGDNKGYSELDNFAVASMLQRRGLLQGARFQFKFGQFVGVITRMVQHILQAGGRDAYIQNVIREEQSVKDSLKKTT